MCTHSSAYHDAHFSLNKIPFVSGYICVSGLWIVGGAMGGERIFACMHVQEHTNKSKKDE